MLNFKFDTAAIAKEIEEKAQALAKGKIDHVVNYAVNNYFATPTNYNKFPGGEGYLLVKDMVDNYLLSDNLKAKTDALVVKALENAIVGVVQKAAEHHVSKNAFASVKEMAEKDPQTLLQLIVNHQPEKKE